MSMLWSMGSEILCAPVHAVRLALHADRRRLTNSMTITHCTAFSNATITKVSGSENFVGRKLLGAMRSIILNTAKDRQDIAGEGRDMRSTSCSDEGSSLCSWINM